MGVGERAANEMVPWVLASAAKVSFSRSISLAKIMSVARVDRLHLRALTLSNKSADVAFITLLSNCSQLESLTVNGVLLGKGPIHISHPKLRRLEFEWPGKRYLTVKCPNLIHLSTDGDWGVASWD